MALAIAPSMSSLRKLPEAPATIPPNWRYLHTHFGNRFRFDPSRSGTVVETEMHAMEEARSLRPRRIRKGERRVRPRSS